MGEVVLPRTLTTAEWADTTVAAGETTEGIDELRRGGDGHIVVRVDDGPWLPLMRVELGDSPSSTPNWPGPGRC